MTRVYDYFKLLFQMYKIFFKATLLISVVVVALTPLEALAPVLGVQAGQRLVDQLSAQQPYGYFFCLWTLATVLTQVLPVVGTNFQRMLTDKLTGFIKLSFCVTMIQAKVRSYWMRRRYLCIGVQAIANISVQLFKILVVLS